jgi:hypothetical protein
LAAALSGSTETISAPVPTSPFWSSAAVRALTPRKARVAEPVVMISCPMRWTVLLGMAKPTPMLPLCDCEPGTPEATVAIAVLMPMTSPAPLTSAPPELPGLIAASVCRASITVASSWVEPVATARSVALMMPSVTVFDRPSGAPMATATSPTWTSSESANVAGLRSSAPSSRTTARSDAASVPTTVAS